MKRNEGQSLGQTIQPWFGGLSSTWCWEPWWAVSHSDTVVWRETVSFNGNLPTEVMDIRGKEEALPQGTCLLLKSGYSCNVYLFLPLNSNLIAKASKHMMTKLCIISSLLRLKAPLLCRVCEGWSLHDGRKPWSLLGTPTGLWDWPNLFSRELAQTKLDEGYNLEKSYRYLVLGTWYYTWSDLYSKFKYFNLNLPALHIRKAWSNYSISKQCATKKS